MQQINLVDQRLLPPRQLVSGLRLLVVATVGLAAVSLHLGVEQDRMARTIATSGTPEPVVSLESTSPEQDTQLRTRLLQRQALRDALAKSAALPADSARLLSEVMAALPDNIWLTEVDLVGTQGLRITGGALEPTALRSFADRLAGIPALKGVPVETLRLEPETGQQERPVAAHSFVLVSAAYGSSEAQR